MVHMTRAMAVEWGKYGINTNAHPPGISTEINEDVATEQGKKLIEMCRHAEPGQARKDSTGLLPLWRRGFGFPSMARSFGRWRHEATLIALQLQFDQLCTSPDDVDAAGLRIELGGCIHRAGLRSIWRA